MRRFAMIAFTTAFVGCVASSAYGQSTLQCDGLESGGTGDTSCPVGPGADPRDYAYPLTADLFESVMVVQIGTDDCNPANYTNICMPPDWVFSVDPIDEDHDMIKTPHGVATGAPTGVGPCVVTFSGGTPIPPGGMFTFGFNQTWPSHDVGWDAQGTLETWGAPSGDGVGPVHGPGGPIGACCYDHCEGCPCELTRREKCEAVKNAIYHGDGSTCDPNPCDSGDPGVPTVSGWGLAVVTLLAVVGGTIMLNRRRRLAA